MEKIWDVTALGELLVDFTPLESRGPNPAFEANPGGAPCNVLAMLSALGRKTAFIGKVGADYFGGMLHSALEELGISAEGLLHDRTQHHPGLCPQRHRWGAELFLLSQAGCGQHAPQPGSPLFPD